MVVSAGHRNEPAQAEPFLTDPASAVRVAALGAMARCRTLTVQHLRAAFADDSGAVRARAGELAVAVDGITPADLLDDPDPQVVEIACFACGEHEWLHTPPIAQLSAIAEGHDDALCRESAAAALGAIGDPAGLNAVLTACTDRVTVRRRAVLALAAFDDPLADEALHRALSDKDWQVRQAAEDLLEVGRSLEGEPDDGAYAID